MFEKLNSLFVFLTEELASGELSKNEPEETKKCKKCLKRVDLKYEKCPYCRYGDFQYNNN